jgi:glutathione S-transferase
VATGIQRFEEFIAGRLYLIEAAPVGPDRWRACIVRVPGVPTALMPFYGRTADEAARHLKSWLARAHERASEVPRPV